MWAPARSEATIRPLLDFLRLPDRRGFVRNRSVVRKHLMRPTRELPRCEPTANGPQAAASEHEWSSSGEADMKTFSASRPHHRIGDVLLASHSLAIGIAARMPGIGQFTDRRRLGNAGCHFVRLGHQSQHLLHGSIFATTKRRSMSQQNAPASYDSAPYHFSQASSHQLIGLLRSRRRSFRSSPAINSHSAYSVGSNSCFFRFGQRFQLIAHMTTGCKH